MLEVTTISTSQATHRSGVLVDVAGSTHLVEIKEQSLLLDGQPVVIQEVGWEQLCFKTEVGVVTCSTEAFCHALLGEAPLSPGDIGLLLGQNMTRWLTEVRTTRTLQCLQAELQSILEERERELRTLLLPEMGLAPFVKQVLETFDGSVDSEQAIGYILKKQTHYTHARIHELIAQAGERMGVLTPSSVETVAGEVERPNVVASGLIGSTIASTAVAPGENQNQETAANGSLQAGTVDSQGTSGLPDWLTQKGPAATDTDITPDPAAGSFQWTEALEEELRRAFSALTEGTTASIAQTIAEERGWPVGSVKYKLYELRLPQKRRQEKQHAETSPLVPAVPSSEEDRVPPVTASSLTTAPVAETDAAGQDQVPVLKPGPFQWTVVVDGLKQNWRLDYSYGNFPLLHGQFSLHGERYEIEKVSINQLVVSRVTSVPSSEQAADFHLVPASV